MLDLVLKLLPGAVVGGVLVAAGLVLYNFAIENPAVRAEERLVVQAENERFTSDAINEIASNADKARAMRRYCQSVGKLFNFEKLECWD